MLSLFNKTIDKSVFRFLMVGVVNTIVGSAIMFIAYNVFHFSYWVSSALNYFLASILSFFLNKFFTFQNHSNTAKAAVRFTLHILICYLLAYGIAKPTIEWILTSASQTVRGNVALLLGMGLFVVFNYTGQRLFVFKK